MKNRKALPINALRPHGLVLCFLFAVQTISASAKVLWVEQSVALDAASERQVAASIREAPKIEVQHASHLMQVMKSNPRLLVEFGSKSCTPCRRFDQEVLKNHDVLQNLGKMDVRIAVVNFSTLSNESSEWIQQRFSLEAMPTFLIQNANGKHVQTVGYEPETGLPDLLSKIQTAMRTER